MVETGELLNQTESRENNSTGSSDEMTSRSDDVVPSHSKVSLSDDKSSSASETLLPKSFKEITIDSENTCKDVVPENSPLVFAEESNDPENTLPCNLSVKFNPNGLAHTHDDDNYAGEGFSSPSASRAAFAFGSLDIIMENDKSKTSAVDKKDDPTDKPQRWGWVVVVASWIIMIPIAGVLASFGTIVSSLTEDFNATKFEAGWIGSLAFSFTVGTCPLSTPLFTVYGARKVALIGVIGATVSLAATSFAPVVHLLFLTYSAMLGVFANFVYNTSMNLTGQYFPRKHQAFATCLASAGISFGTLLVNPLAGALVTALGWRNTMRIMAAIIFVVGVACVATFKPVKTREQKIQTKIRHMSKKALEKEKEFLSEPALKNVDIEALSESIQAMHTESRLSLAAQEIKKNVFNKGVWDCSICGNPAFLLWMLGSLLWSVSFLFPFIFLIDYMETIGIPRDTSTWVMTAYGVAEFCGRLICACAAGKIRFSLAYVYGASAAVVGVATLFAPLGKTLAIMYVYAIVAGINSGILNSLMFVATMQFFGNDRGRHVWGYINVMLAVGMVIGPVIAGGIYDVTASYVSAFYMGGSVFILCAVVMCLIPFALNHYPVQNEPEKKIVRQKVPPPSSRSQAKNGSIVKPGALRKLAQQQAALKAAGKTSKKSKFNGDVHAHLQELDSIENEVVMQNCQRATGNDNDTEPHGGERDNQPLM
ncbi:monocarboxylate transporter 5-like [Clavelina lepadiformis]|uniref:monocarboxylate transporter 5-like n=1 Tax=Clavelina lepadiformis TaxID=159417 RepID=UPI0040412A20